ncbi:MAG: hypothetical protein WCF23_11710 [Candidatus Nitrosopolaris sp.]
MAGVNSPIICQNNASTNKIIGKHALRVIFKELGTWASRWKVPRITTKTKSAAAARSAR